MTHEVKTYLIPAHLLDQHWPTFGPMIELAQKRLEDQCGMDDVIGWLRDGKSHLWGVFVDGKPMAAMMTSDNAYPRKRVMVIEMIGGKRADLWSEDALAELARVARATGFNAIETHARAGWSKLAKRYMFTFKHVAYELEL
jgi:hypothetical protein